MDRGRLANEVWRCPGGRIKRQVSSNALHVQGAGLNEAGVVGFNRNVDWPTLVERLVAVGKGEVAPVIE